MAKPAKFGLIVRAPKWARMPPLVSDFKLTVNDEPGVSTGTLGYAVVRPREWKDGDRVKLSFTLVARLILGHFGDTGRAALNWGPFVLAYDASMNPGLPADRHPGPAERHPPFTLEPGPELEVSRPRRRPEGRRPEVQPSSSRSPTRGPAAGPTASGCGPRGSSPRRTCRSWPTARRAAPGWATRTARSSTATRAASWSPSTAKSREEDWYAVTLPRRRRSPASSSRTARISTTAAGSTPRGGKPRVQVQRSREGMGDGRRARRPIRRRPRPTPPTSSPGSRSSSGSSSPVSAVAVRVIGVPSSGDNPDQAFSSCGELQAFAD